MREYTHGRVKQQDPPCSFSLGRECRLIVSEFPGTMPSCTPKKQRTMSEDTCASQTGPRGACVVMSSACEKKNKRQTIYSNHGNTTYVVLLSRGISRRMECLLNNGIYQQMGRTTVGRTHSSPIRSIPRGKASLPLSHPQNNNRLMIQSNNTGTNLWPLWVTRRVIAFPCV